MQIDFHHAVTYVVARLGGLNAASARTVAHAAQYVDDATHDGSLDFSTGERYVRVTSAHKTLDIQQNSNAADNRLVWVPFHFLPGNLLPNKGTLPAEAFLHRMMCQPDSQVARDLVADCIRRQDLPYALHRLGVGLHTYVDTWAHQKFVGLICDLNKIDKAEALPDSAYDQTQAFADLTGGLSQLKAFVAGHLPVGHAAATTLPDMPFLKWRFRRHNGESVERDNPTDFLAAAEAAFNVVRRYVAKDAALASIPLPAADKAAIDRLLRGTVMIDGESRHAIWLSEISQGTFSFGCETVEYIDHGPGSWKMQALGWDPDDDGNHTFDFTPSFMTSDWRYFHDAVQHQRLFVLHELLPRYGLCAS